MPTYSEALKKADEFMKVTGLRALCAEVCQGVCCCGAWENGRCKSLLSCHDKLPCVGYLCSEMYQYLQTFVPVIGELIFQWNNNIFDVIRKRIWKDNIYFTPFSLAKMRGLRFREIFDPAPPILAEIKRAIDRLRAEAQSLELTDQAGQKLYANGWSKINEAISRIREEAREKK